jgi:hypothetical protein
VVGGGTSDAMTFKSVEHMCIYTKRLVTCSTWSMTFNDNVQNCGFIRGEVNDGPISNKLVQDDTHHEGDVLYNDLHPYCYNCKWSKSE